MVIHGTDAKAKSTSIVATALLMWTQVRVVMDAQADGSAISVFSSQTGTQVTMMMAMLKSQTMRVRNHRNAAVLPLDTRRRVAMKADLLRDRET